MQNLGDGMFFIIGMLLFAFLAVTFGMWAEPYIMKSEFMKKLIGIEECKLSEEQRMGLISKLDYQIKEFVEDWVAIELAESYFESMKKVDENKGE